MSLVFYDTETTGLEAAFDQILEFAAVRVDHNLEVIESFERGSRLLPHVVPSLGAMRVNRMTPARLQDPSLPSHYAMAREIHLKMLSWSPSLFVGYNSIDFDEHMLRHSLYRTLHPPYLTNTNGNSRSDVLRMARATALFSPGVLSVPFNPDDSQAFDLYTLARANGFRSAEAHAAAIDVEATLHLARLIMDGAPSLWSGFMRFGQKSAVLAYAREEAMFSLTDFYFGRPYSWLVTTIGASTGNTGELIVFDLQVDPDELAMLDDVDLAIRLQNQPKPLRRLRSNASPIIMPVDDAPSIAAATWVDQKELERRAIILRHDKSLAARLVAAFEGIRKSKEVSPYVEARLYDGTFTSNDDLPILEAFHAAPWHERPAILERLADSRLRELGEELIYIEWPDALPAHRRLHHQTVHAGRLAGSNGNVPWATLRQAIEEIDTISLDCQPDERAFLFNHRTMLNQRLIQLSFLAA